MTLKPTEHLITWLQLQVLMHKVARLCFHCMEIISGLPTL